MKKRNSSGKYIAGLILLIALCVFGVFITTKGITKNNIGRASNIELGLDLAGGVSITYEVDGKNVSDSDMKDTVYKLQKRVEDYSEEAQVYQEGDDRITVEIPGVTDANKILEDLGKPGSLEFQDESGNVVLDGSDIAGADGGVRPLLSHRRQPHARHGRHRPGACHREVHRRSARRHGGSAQPA